jgi:ankyrin repeat protein
VDALWSASLHGCLPDVRVLVERGADPTIVDEISWAPLMAASAEGHLEVVRSLLGHPSVKASIKHRADNGERRCGWPAEGGVGGS